MHQSTAPPQNASAAAGAGAGAGAAQVQVQAPAAAQGSPAAEEPAQTFGIKEVRRRDEGDEDDAMRG